MSEMMKKIRILLGFMTGYRKVINISIFFGTLNRFLSVIVVAYSSYVVGKALEQPDPQFVLQHMGYLFVIGVLKALSSYGEMYWVHYLAYDILFDYRSIVYKKINEISPMYILNERTGNVSSTLMDDVEQLEIFYAHTVTAYIVSILASVVLCVILSFISLKLLIVVIPIIVIILIVPFLFVGKVKEKGDLLKKQLARLNAEMIDILQGVKEILIFGKKNNFKSKVEKESKAYGIIQLEEGALLGIQNAMISVLLSIALISVMLLANKYYNIGEIGRGMLPLISVLSVYIFIPIVGVSNTAGSFGIIEASADRIFKILHATPVVSEKNQTKDTKNELHSVRFENVYFSYEKDKEVLSGVTFDVASGENVVLVGKSGAGKSTCFHLLLRFWDVKQGSIKIGNVDIRDMSFQDLRNKVSYVSQDVYLFNMSVRENIALGRENFTDEEVISAAKAAYADEFIQRLPEGYDTIIGERGFRLSGGEKARIAIARALMKNSPILLLDEAVSNLDNKNERLVESAIKNLAKNRTIITIAHRLATIKNADRIVVLHDGKTLETGTHEALITKKGSYYKLVTNE